MVPSGDTGISGPVFAIGSVLLLVLVGAAMWFAIPGPDNRHRFVSPSGAVVLEVGEACREDGCERVVVSEERAPDGSTSRLGCVVDLNERWPVLVNVHPLWSPDERSVDIVYADSEGVGGKFTLSLPDDCMIEA